MIEEVEAPPVTMTATEQVIAEFTERKATLKGLCGAIDRMQLPEEPIHFHAVVRRFERILIAQAMVRANGNTAAASRMLCVHRPTLLHKLTALNKPITKVVRGPSDKKISVVHVQWPVE